MARERAQAHPPGRWDTAIWARAKRQADEFAAGFVGPDLNGETRAEPEPHSVSIGGLTTAERVAVALPSLKPDASSVRPSATASSPMVGRGGRGQPGYVKLDGWNRWAGS